MAQSSPANDVAVMAGTSTAVRRKADSRRRQIAGHAANLFDAAGSTSPTMDDIAAAAGIAKPTLYHYFKSKDEILLEIHEAFIDLLIERHSDRMRSAMTGTDLLLGAMTDIFELRETHHGHVRVFFEYYRQLPEPHRTIIRTKRNLYHSMIEDTIRRGVADGEFRDVDPTLTTIAVFGLCNWSHLELSRVAGKMRPRQFAQTFGDYIIQGITAPGHGSTGGNRRSTEAR
jgi:AcrR family transcriptional regulator